MSIDKETVARIARLARLHISEDEQESFARELSGIMSWIEQLKNVDTDGIEPMTSNVDSALYLRPDEVTDGNIQEDILKNAPEATAGFFVVPKVVE